jgi:hypothetical protein
MSSLPNYDLRRSIDIALRDADSLSTKLANCINQLEENGPKGVEIGENLRSSWHQPQEVSGGWTRYTEQDEDDEIIQELFGKIDADGDKSISASELKTALDKEGVPLEVGRALEDLLNREGQEPLQNISFDKFRKVIKEFPRVRGERIHWVRTLDLESELARFLKKGDIFDGLKGLKEMSESELEHHIEVVCRRFCNVLPVLLRRGLASLRSSGRPLPDAQEHINTKFSLDGAFVGKFATLDDFYSGPEALIGAPNPKVGEGMRLEHCRRSNCRRRFTTSNYNLTTWPELEWEFVVCPRDGVAYPHTPKDPAGWPPGCGWRGHCGRDAVALDAFLALPAVARAAARAGLSWEEIAALRLYTGPLFLLYNAVLRRFPARDVACLEGNAYETTIFAVASGVTKLSKVTGIPPGRRLYRGLGGMLLPRQFWEEYDECLVALAVRAPSPAAAERARAALQACVTRARPPFPLAGTLAQADLQSPAAPSALPADAEAAAPEAAAAKSYDMADSFLLLPWDGPVAAVAASGLRVVQEPAVSAGGGGAEVRLVVAAALAKFDLTEEMRGGIAAAVEAACGHETVVESVANKPRDFRGGGAWRA